MKKFALAIVCSLFASAASAAVIVQIDQTPTEGLPGSLTSIVTLVSDNPNEIIFGVDASFDGPLGQVNPLGMATPFNDLNGFFGEVPVAQDSQFLFHSANDLSPPALGTDESDSTLKAAITNLPGATGGDGTNVPLAQIAHRLPVNYSFSIDLRDQSGAAVGNPTVAGVIPVVPEPATVGLFALAMVGFVGLRRRS